MENERTQAEQEQAGRTQAEQSAEHEQEQARHTQAEQSAEHEQEQAGHTQTGHVQAGHTPAERTQAGHAQAESAQTGALVVAAGLSSRMGSFKPLLKFGRATAIEHVIRTLQGAGAAPLVLVTGYQAELLEAHAIPLGAVCLRNEHYASTHMLDSVNIGLRYLQGRCGRVLMTPADVPLFSAETVRRLMSCGADIAIPTYGGRKGHPILLSCRLIPHIEGYTGPGGLGGAIGTAGSPPELVETNDAGILHDMDAPADYQRLLQLYERQQQGG